MCGILCAEFLIEGQKHGRLQWPYGDLVPGSYLAAWITDRRHYCDIGRDTKQEFVLGWAVLLLGVVSGCLMTGERINSLVLISAACLAVFLSKPYKSMHLCFTRFWLLGLPVSSGWTFWMGIAVLCSSLVKLLGSATVRTSVLSLVASRLSTPLRFWYWTGHHRYLAPDILPQGAGARTTTPITILFRFCGRLAL